VVCGSAKTNGEVPVVVVLAIVFYLGHFKQLRGSADEYAQTQFACAYTILQNYPLWCCCHCNV